MKPIAARSLSDAERVPQRRAFLAAAVGTALGAALSTPLRRVHAEAAWPVPAPRSVRNPPLEDKRCSKRLST